MTSNKMSRIGRLLAGAIVAGAAVGIPAGVAFGALRPGGEGPGVEESLVAQASAGQREMLSDGVITDTERETAARNAANCMREAGLEAEPGPGVNPGIGIHGTLGEREEAIVKACAARHLDAVALAWAGQHRPDSATRRAVAEETTACFVANGGHQGGGVLGREEVHRILLQGSEEEATALGNCLQTNMERYGFAF